MAEVVVLGSGTSNGVPMLGMDYSPDFLANPKNHRMRCSIVLKGPEGNVLVDCSPEMRLQMIRADIKRIEGVIITHTHADHIMGMDDLRSFCVAHRMDIPVFTYERYQDDIRRIFAYAFQDHGDPEILVPRFILQEMPPVLEMAGLEIERLDIWHGEWPVIGLRINDFAYLTDVNRIPDEVMARLSGLDTLILDAVRYRPHPNHFNYDQAIVVAQTIGAKKTYFTHLSADYDHDIVNAELPKGIELAYDGLSIGL
ncbi:MAG: MBL fold metallo-hydrolase [Fimbriimonadaceae bacterium]|nr:MBL fold metallo-hydrolase [Fimbriimonadaceae bacterium]